MNLADDERLLQEYLHQGSQQAFCELVNQHLDLVSRVVHKRISDHESAEEVIQNVFALLARKASRLTRHPSLGGWLVKTAVFEAKKHHRREATRMKRESKLTQEGSQASPETESAAFTEEDFESVETALAELSPKLRDAIMLRYYHRAPYNVIGAKLGKTSDAAQKTVSRGIERLKQMIASQNGSPRFSASAISALLTTLLSAQAKTVGASTGIGLAALKSASSVTTSTLISNAIYTTMTTAQIKTAAAVSLAIALPLAYQWRDSQNTPIDSAEPSVRTSVEDSTPAPQNQESETALSMRPGSTRSAFPESNPNHTPRSHPLTATANPTAAVPERWRDREANNLIRDLSDEEWKVRRGAAALLNGSHVPAEKAVPALQLALQDEEWQVRKVVADALAFYGPDSKSATLELADALYDEEWHVRESAAFALSKIGPEASQAVPALTETLNDEEWHVRRTAAEALAEIGPAARDAVPALTERLLDEEWQVRSPAAKALAMLGPDSAPAIEVLGQSLGDEEWPVVVNASAALAAIGPQAETEVPALLKALNHPESQVKQAAALALGAINPQSSEVTEHLMLQSASESAPVAQAAIEALQMIRQSNP